MTTVGPSMQPSQFDAQGDAPESLPTSRPAVGLRELQALEAVLASRWLGTGARTREFEQAVGARVGARHVVAVVSGTAALHLALEALDLGSGDEVIAPSMTFVSTIQAILAAGARPVFCEIDEKTGNLDVADALSRIAPRTRALLPVHYGGAVCDMDALIDEARRREVRIVEDAAHAFGSYYKDRPVGSLGDVTCFSFDPIKNITCGQGGAVVTNDPQTAERLLPLANVGLTEDSWDRRLRTDGAFPEVRSAGYRYRMSDLNAAIGLVQLSRMEELRLCKVEVVRRYDDAFASLDGLELLDRGPHRIFPFNYAVRVVDGRRDELMAFLRDRGIRSTVHFPPNHLQPAFRDYRTQLPVTERYCRETISLPLFAEMRLEDAAAVVNAVVEFFAP